MIHGRLECECSFKDSFLVKIYIVREFPFFMIVTITGKPGAGKSTVGRIIAERLRYKHYSMGDLQRSIAQERNITLEKLGKLEEESDEIDKEIEAKQEKLGKKEDNFVIDGRLSFHFISHSKKIFLDVSEEVGATRIMSDEREAEHYDSLEEAQTKISERIESEKKRYRTYYGIDHLDISQFDVVIDTTNLTIEEVVDHVLEVVQHGF